MPAWSKDVLKQTFLNNLIQLGSHRRDLIS